MEKQAEYIRQLEEKNRRKRMMNAKSSEEQAKEELERGFSTHFHGANAPKERKTPAQSKVVAPVKPLLQFERLLNKDNSKPSNKGWNLEKDDSEGSHDYVNFDSGDNEEMQEDTGLAKMENVTEAGGLTSSPDSKLKNKINNLSAEQKLKLLQLLEKDVGSASEPTGAAAEDSSSAVKATNFGNSVDDEEGSFGKEEQEDNGELPMKVPALLNSIDPEIRSLVEGKFNFRVRILTAQSRTKFVALQFLRLFLQQPPSPFTHSGVSDISNLSSTSNNIFPLDIIPQLTKKVVSGMLPLQTSSETVRTLPLLTSTDKFERKKVSSIQSSASRFESPFANCWKGPMNGDSSLEIVLEGFLTPETQQILINSFPSPSDLRLAFRLAIWNAPDSTDELCSAARDVDVYAGSKCVWSGELPVGAKGGLEASGILTLNTGNANMGDDCLTSASLALTPLSDQRGVLSQPTALQTEAVANESVNMGDMELLSAGSASLQAGRQSFSRHHQQEQNSDLQQSTMLLSQIGAKGIFGQQQEPQPPVVEQPEDTAGKPSWLLKSAPMKQLQRNNDNLGILNADVDLNMSGSISVGAKAVRSGRRSNVADTPTIKEGEAAPMAGAPLRNPFGSNLPSAGQSRVQSASSHDLELSGSFGGSTSRDVSATKRGRRNRNNLEPNKGVPSFLDTGSKKQREVALQKSIEAVNFAEHINLGRLSRTSSVAGSLQASKQGSPKHGTGAAEPFLDSFQEKEPAAVDSDDEMDFHKFLQNNKRVVPVKQGSANKRESSQSRTEKIGAVQQKVHNSLVQLADIMSDIQAKKEVPPLQPTVEDDGLDNTIQTNGVYALENPYPLSNKKPTGERSAVADVKLGSTALVSAKESNFLPRGQVFVLQVLSTWGDEHYVGLNGLEFYDQQGNLMSFRPARDDGGDLSEEGSGIQSIDSVPSDLNIFPEYANNDPRVVTNLLNGANFTKNDMNMWLAPQLGLVQSLQESTDLDEKTLTTKTALKETNWGSDWFSSPFLTGDAACFTSDEGKTLVRDNVPLLASVIVQFHQELQQLSMVRVYNFNKSRTRNQRGVRRCRFVLDGTVIFDGEIQRATGQLTSVESESQLISFTNNEEIMKKVGENIPLAPEEDEPADLSVSAVMRPGTSAGPSKDPADGRTSPSDELQVSGHSSISIFDRSNDPYLDPAASKVGNNGLAMAAASAESTAFQEAAGDWAAPDPSLQDSSSYLAQTLRRTQQSALDHSTTPILKTVQEQTKLEDKAMSSLLKYVRCRKIRIDIESTWGDPCYVGLCGLQVLVGPQCRPYALKKSNLKAEPEDLSSVGRFDDPRVLGNLVNGFNDTAQDDDMWLIPFTKKSEHYLLISLPEDVDVVGLRFWNYNKSSEDVMRGVRRVSIKIDGRTFLRTTLRRGPGSDGVGFAQTLLFHQLFSDSNSDSNAKLANPLAEWHIFGMRGKSDNGRTLTYQSPEVRQDYETLSHPCALSWRFTFTENWNDEYYIGLDRLELYDAEGGLIDLSVVGGQVTAVPYSVQDLGLANSSTALLSDPRTPEKLFYTALGTNPLLSTPNQIPGFKPCWLAPLAKCMTVQERAACAVRINNKYNQKQNSKASDYKFPRSNILTVQFQYPVALSMIKVFNYSKSPKRGVKEMLIEADGNCVYLGSLLPADQEKTTPGYGNNPTQSRGQAILFTNDPKIINVNKDLVNYCGATEQDVLCINERQVMVRSKNMYEQETPNQSLEGIKADLTNRPMTAYVS